MEGPDPCALEFKGLQTALREAATLDSGVKCIIGANALACMSPASGFDQGNATPEAA
jgi:hypothetical protein